MIEKNLEDRSISVQDAKEVIELIGKLDNDQKKIVLNVLRGVALIAEAEYENKRGEVCDNT